MIRKSCLLAVLLATPVFAAPTWSPFVIRQNAAPVTPLYATGTADGSAFSTLIDEASEKTGYGTNFFNGQTVGTLTGLGYNRADAGTASAYLNVWVTDGTHYAVIAPVVGMNGTGNYTGGVDVRNQNLQTLGFNVYETDTSNLTWMYAGATRVNQALIGPGGHVVTLSDIAGLTIADPGTYSSFVGSGAPKNGTGFNLIFGDTQGNFSSGTPYVLSNVTVPEPASLAVLGAGLAATVLRRRRTT